MFTGFSFQKVFISLCIYIICGFLTVQGTKKQFQHATNETLIGKCWFLSALFS